jgi:signal peptide peptidase SppA
MTPRLLLLQLFARSPLWAIKPEAALLAIMQASASAEQRLSPEWEAAKPSVITRAKGDKTAIIPIQGVLTKDGPSWYGSNYETIQAAAERAMSDPDVKRVILQVDSPGGEVTGLPETAATLAQLAKTKPVHAMVEGDSASAAYWLTSQASDITVTPSGSVGSVGVRMMHADISKMLEDAGVTITEMHAGEFKTEWSPYKPLTDEAKADMQSRLDTMHADFKGAIATGRGNRATADIAERQYGGGRMFSAAEAKSHGLADNVQATRDFYKAVLPVAEETPAVPAFGIQRARLENESRRFTKV